MNITISPWAAYLACAASLLVAFSLPVSGVVKSTRPDDNTPAAEKYVLPEDVDKLKATALAELLRQQPELKEDDLSFNTLTYHYRAGFRRTVNLPGVPEPHLVVREEHQTVSVNFLVPKSRREEEHTNRTVVLTDVFQVSFPNLYSPNFQIRKTFETVYR